MTLFKKPYPKFPRSFVIMMHELSRKKIFRDCKRNSYSGAEQISISSFSPNPMKSYTIDKLTYGRYSTPYYFQNADCPG